jgi:hypothetical protein
VRRNDRATVIKRYVLAVAVGNLIWELAQLPLNTLWRTGSGRSLLRAVVHWRSWAYTEWMPTLHGSAPVSRHLRSGSSSHLWLWPGAGTLAMIDATEHDHA